MPAPPGPQPLGPGRLLIANPLLPDPNFDRTVVLLIAYGGEGALGLVLNRPSQMKVSEPLPLWEPLAAEPAVLFLGGPVQHQAVICLTRRTSATALSAEGVKEVAPGVATVDLDQTPDSVAGGVGPVRLFAGYSGWAAGQLEGEMDAGAWWVVDAVPDDVFTAQPERLWIQVLRRQPPPLCYAAYYPDEPEHQ